MLAIPTFVLTLWGGGLFSMALFGVAAYATREWYRRCWVYDLRLERFVFQFELGWNVETAWLTIAIALLAWAVFGRLLSGALRGLLGGAGRGGGESAAPQPLEGGKAIRLRRPDGTTRHVEVFGPEGGTPVVLTHGWGADRTEWSDLVRRLASRHRVILWDLPGLGLSEQPVDRDYRLERLAEDLDAVLDEAGGRPAVLVGHSIGGMILLTYAKAFPERLEARVAGLALVHTTYTNPVRTTRHAALYTALERPLLVPLLYLTIGLWPIVRLMNALSYINGSAHRSTRGSGFSAGGSPGRVDFVARYQVKARPDVVARGMLGMLAYDATPTLPGIGVSTLVIPADKDPVCLPEASDRMIRDIPGAQTSPLAPARHMGLIEHPDKFATAIEAFVTSCVGDRRSIRPASAPVEKLGRSSGQ